MTRILLSLTLLFALTLPGKAQITLDHCLERARDNYPLIKRYDLVRQSEAISLSDIDKGWLPKIGLYAQGTLQNDVPAFPDILKNMLAQTGATVKGTDKSQYKAGIELTQTVWDGGHSASQRKIRKASSAEAEAAIDVEMYAIRERVENIYFGILLMDEQMARIKATIYLLESNHKRLESLVRNGIATQSDADMVEAQALTMRQNLTEARNTADTYRSLLEVYIAESLAGKALVRPLADMPESTQSDRPELRLFEKQLNLNQTKEQAIRPSVMPRIGFFAQAWYGYPRFNMFESMMKRTPSLNAIAGVKVTWNIDGFYTKGNSRHRLAVASDMIRNDRELFLFNSGLKTRQETAEINTLREVMKEDHRIVELRRNVRNAAESQLRHGIIDTTALLTKINDENQALLTQTFHEIQLLQAIYRLRYTLNR